MNICDFIHSYAPFRARITCHRCWGLFILLTSDFVGFCFSIFVLFYFFLFNYGLFLFLFRTNPTNNFLSVFGVFSVLLLQVNASLPDEYILYSFYPHVFMCFCVVLI